MKNYSYLFVLLLTLLMTLITALGSQSLAADRVASIYVSQDFINEQITAHSKAQIIQQLKVELNTDHSQITLRGKVHIPTEELRAINLDPQLGLFNFQVTLKPETTPEGHLILEFPLAETYFYPSNSTDPIHERIVVPVQLLSVALASIRGYLAALSGDFSGFERRTEKLKALIASVDHSIAHEKNRDAVDELKNQRQGLVLQLEAVPIERKQLQTLSKEVEHILGFTGEKELNLNEELGARKNALVLKIKLAQIAPYLTGVTLGGVRMVLDKKDGGGENYLAVDVNSELAMQAPPGASAAPRQRPPMKTAPALILRLKQSLFQSQALINAESQATRSKLRDFEINLRDDGFHVSGIWRLLLFSIPFETTVDFVTTELDSFEVRVRELSVAGLDLEFLAKSILEAIQTKLAQTLKRTCTFQYVGELKDHSRALKVTIDPRALVPAFPDLHLIAVDVRDQELLLKIGRP